jgi:hypothetical protein
MNRKINCCGMICDDCEFTVEDCSGCAETKGNPFWLQYTEHAICPIYSCCIDEHNYSHCGNCQLLPCDKYTENGGDPTISSEENIEILEMQIAQLKHTSNQ